MPLPPLPFLAFLHLALSALSYASPQPYLATYDDDLSLIPRNTLFLRQLSDLQSFHGALGGIQAPSIHKSKDPKNQFDVDGQDFGDFATAGQQSCLLQYNWCCDLANNPQRSSVASVANASVITIMAATPSSSASSSMAAKSSSAVEPSPGMAGAQDQLAQHATMPSQNQTADRAASQNIPSANSSIPQAQQQQQPQSTNNGSDQQRKPPNDDDNAANTRQSQWQSQPTNGEANAQHPSADQVDAQQQKPSDCTPPAPAPANATQPGANPNPANTNPANVSSADRNPKACGIGCTNATAACPNANPATIKPVDLNANPAQSKTSHPAPGKLVNPAVTYGTQSPSPAAEQAALPAAPPAANAKKTTPIRAVANAAGAEKEIVLEQRDSNKIPIMQQRQEPMQLSVRNCDVQRNACNTAQQHAPAMAFAAPVACMNIGPDPVFPEYDLICEL